MTELVTRVEIPKPSFGIDYQSSILLMGSCFTEHIGKRMHRLKFNTLYNPFGVVYNPVFLTNQISMLIHKDSFTADDLHYFNELWFSFSHYTLFSDPDQNICLAKINEQFLTGKNFLLSSDVIIFTLGTSYAYKLHESGEVVANCHKMPADRFERFFSSSENSCSHLSDAIRKIRNTNPEVKFIFTVSPIRHWKDGAIDNMRSKAALIMAIAELQARFTGVYYFPVYEIFMDEMRDYRFYADDMLHPSSLATEMIWERFVQSFLTPDAINTSREIQSLLKSLDHRPMQTSSTGYKRFIRDLKYKLHTLENKYSFLNFQEERSLIDKIV